MRFGRILFIGILAATVFCVTAAGAATTRGLTLQYRATASMDAPIAGTMQLYARSYALVVGNDTYTGGWGRLSQARKDARLVAAALKERGFDVTLKLDLNATALEQAFEDFFLEKGAYPEARLFVWYAGHGHTMKGEGYLVPTDGPLPSERIGFLRKAISLRDFGKFMRLAESKHVFTIFDSCFAGTIFNVARAAPPPAITRVTAEPVRQFLTSGEAGQLVSDDGTFAKMFVDTLAGKRPADANGDGYLTASELGLHLTDAMSNYTRNAQTPRHGKMRDPELNKGDFVFKLASVPADQGTIRARPGSPTSGTDKETVFWQSVKDSADPDMFEAYLSQYPNGSFAGLARIKIRKLQKQAAVRPAPNTGANRPKQLVPAVVRPRPRPPARPRPPGPGRKPSSFPIAIPAFVGGNAEQNELGRKIAEVITADLERSGLFRPIDERAFIQASISPNALPRFDDWRVINARSLALGSVGKGGAGKLKINFRLWDVVAGQQQMGRSYSTIKENWRRVAHIVADAIYERLIGDEGHFDTRIVYIAESGPPDKRVKRLAIMDQDGENHRFITDGRYRSATPRFSPKLQEIAYQSDFSKKRRVYIFNLDTGRQEVLRKFSGVTFDPRFSPDGKSVIMGLDENGNSDIVVMNLRTRAVKKLTSHSADEKTPGFSPNGKRIVFNSDRGGTPQLYVMNNDGKDKKRISFGKGDYVAPAWSPRGDLIAFVKKHNSRSFLGIMRSDGGGERLLDEGALVNSPTWSPNGRVLMFAKQSRDRRSRLYTINLSGHNLRELKTPAGASDPNWSAPIP